MQCYEYNTVYQEVFHNGSHSTRVMHFTHTASTYVPLHLHFHQPQALPYLPINGKGRWQQLYTTTTTKQKAKTTTITQQEAYNSTHCYKGTVDETFVTKLCVQLTAIICTQGNQPYKVDALSKTVSSPSLQEVPEDLSYQKGPVKETKSHDTTTARN